MNNAEREVMGFRVQSLGVVDYDPTAKTFPSYVFSNMGEIPARYFWGVVADVVKHWTEGSKFTGRFSKDGSVLSGDWRADAGVESTLENSYDATMTRVK